MTIQILVGCDPEVFVKLNGKFQSAFGLIKGDKKNPMPVNKGAVQVDGMALEFNINPAKTEEEFIVNVQEVFNTLRAMVPKYEVVAVPVADFDPSYMKQQPLEALELGCDPDYNAWTLDANKKPDGDRPFRTASGHVHIGWTNGEDITDGGHFSRAANVAKQMDFFLGLPSLAYDKDTKRRSMYGKGGCMRVKPYGVEYRTLSNAWLNSPKLIGWVFRNVQAGMNRLMNGECLYEKHGDIQEIINNSDWKAAKAIIEQEAIEVPHV
ncbi:MAG TPA: hypothetical protein VFM18_21855 [Methanosarcina sp.]|nr:hypothetical protein [Methanosarcina sp.]